MNMTLRQLGAWHELTFVRVLRERRELFNDMAIASQGKGELIVEQLETLQHALDL
jgi:hypothetical protein